MARPRDHVDEGVARKILQSLGAEIQSARKRQKLTQADLANQMRVSVPTLRALETGKETVSLGLLVRAAVELDVGAPLLNLRLLSKP
ncbi:helix-turn-helix domain-containing protein [Polaromonas sp.]|uniref:helix-turn-helix domain-containing protein n=1 Tax=Polaromonas sp. TaxID=1869339 RepID=UPI00352A2141